jgi:hypothetical protein
MGFTSPPSQRSTTHKSASHADPPRTARAPRTRTRIAVQAPPIPPRSTAREGRRPRRVHDRSPRGGPPVTDASLGRGQENRHRSRRGPTPDGGPPWTSSRRWHRGWGVFWMMKTSKGATMGIVVSIVSRLVRPLIWTGPHRIQRLGTYEHAFEALSLACDCPSVRESVDEPTQQV